MILKNTSDQPITATTGHTVPAGGSLTVTGATLERIKKERYIAIQLKKGRLVAEPDPAPEPEGMTRETIAKAKKAELLEIILAHYENATAADFKGVPVEGEDGLRAIASRLLFVDL